MRAILRAFVVATLTAGISVPQARAEDAAAPAVGVIDIEVVGLRSDLGGVMVHLYSSAKGFPSKPDTANARLYLTPTARGVKASFPDLPYGEYAVAVCHDENANTKCDKNFLGIPKEGVGTSNDAKGFMGPPSFNNARVKLEGPTKALTIKLGY